MDSRFRGNDTTDFLARWHANHEKHAMPGAASHVRRGDACPKIPILPRWPWAIASPAISLNPLNLPRGLIADQRLV